MQRVPFQRTTVL